MSMVSDEAGHILTIIDAKPLKDPVVINICLLPGSFVKPSFAIASNTIFQHN